MPEHTNGFQLNLTTSLIFAGIIFVSVLVGGWITQNKDISSLTTSVVAIAADQKLQNNRISLAVERISILENNTKVLNENLYEIKRDLKNIREDQILYYKSMGFKVQNRKE